MYNKLFRRFSIQLLLFIVITLIVHIKLLFFKTQLAYGDLSAFPESFGQAMSDFVFAWKNVSLGIYRQPGHFQTLIQALFLRVFGDPVLSQKIYVLLLPIISFTSFNYFLRKFFSPTKPFAYFIASFFYAYAPVFLQEFVGGTLYSTLLGFALFPLLYFLTYKLIEELTLRNVIILGILLGFILSFYPHMFLIYGLSLLVPFGLDLYLRGVKRVFAWMVFILVGVVSFLVNPLFLLSNFSIISTQGASGAATNFAKSVNLFITDIRYTYFWSSLPNLLRLGNNKSSFDYTSPNFWVLPFYFLLFTILAYFILNKNKITESLKSTVFGLSFLPNFLFIIAFMYLTYSGSIEFLFRHFPVFFMFRNPAKLTSLATFFFAILLFQAIAFFNDFLTTKFKLIVFNVTVLVVTLMYLWPIFTLDRGLSISRKMYTIPESYNKVYTTVNDADKSTFEHRNLWLPASHERTSIKLFWLDKNKLESQIGLSQFSDDYYAQNLSNSLNKLILYKDLAGIRQLLNIAQIKNIILLKDNKSVLDLYEFYGVNFISGGSVKLQESFSFLPKVYEDKRYIVYENSEVPAHLWIGNGMTTVYSPSYANALESVSLTNLSKSNVVFIKEVDTKNGIKKDNDLFPTLGDQFVLGRYIDKTMFMEKTPVLPWPNASIKPFTLKYHLVKLKEYVTEVVTSKPLDKADILVWFAAKRVAEIGAYNISDEEKRTLLNAYVHYIEKAISILKSVTEKERDDNYWEALGRILFYIEKSNNTLSLNFNTEELSLSDSLHRELSTWMEKEGNIFCTHYCYDVSFPSSGSYEVFLNPMSSIIDKATLTVQGNSIFDGSLSSANSNGWYRLGTVSALNTTDIYKAALSLPEMPNLLEDGAWKSPISVKEGSEDLTYSIYSVLSGFDDRSEKNSEGLVKNTKLILWGDSVRFKSITDWTPFTLYKISFDYSTDGGIADLSVVEKLPSSSEVSNSLSRKNTTLRLLSSVTLSPVINGVCKGGECFKHFEKIVQASGNSQGAYIYVYSYSDLGVLVDVKVKNIKVQQVIQPKVAFKKADTSPASESLSAPVISYVRINPSKYKVTIKGVVDPYFLVLNESFHSGWRLYPVDSSINDESFYGRAFRFLGLCGKTLVQTFLKKDLSFSSNSFSSDLFLSPTTFETWGKTSILSDKHYLVNGYANGWYIRPSDIEGNNYEVIVEFEPQRLYYLSIVVSLIAGLSMIFLIILINKKLFSSVRKDI